MQIVLIAGGSRGDVQPYVALGKGLKAAGHRVQVLATQDYESLVTEQGVDFEPMGSGVQAEAQRQMEGVVERGNLLEILAATGRGAEILARQSAVSGLAACQGADLIVAGLGGLFVGLALSEKLHIPMVQAHLMPFTPTREFGSVLAPLPQSAATRWANSLSHRLTRQMMWQMFRGADTKVRADVFQMPSSSFWGPFAALQRQTRSILYGYSPQVIPTPSDWGNDIHVTGYWFLEPPAGWQAPQALVDFLEAGPPPVYIGFGSMPSRNPNETAAMILQALARAGQRGVLSSGWGGLKTENLPDTVSLVGSVPHHWLFPRMAAVVHHGGAGTTAAGLRAGVPSIVTPFFGDQPFWGRRVLALGVGPKPIPRPQLTSDRLAEAIQLAVTDTEMQRKAAALGERIRAEDGTARAVEAIEKSLAR